MVSRCRGQGSGCISAISDRISPYLLASPRISPHLPVSARICPYLPVSARISYLLVSPGISRYLPRVSRHIPPHPAISAISRHIPPRIPRKKPSTHQGLPVARGRTHLNDKVQAADPRPRPSSHVSLTPAALLVASSRHPPCRAPSARALVLGAWVVNVGGWDTTVPRAICTGKSVVFTTFI